MGGLLAAALAAAPALAAGEVRSRPIAGLRADVAAVIMQGVEGGSLPLAVTARPEAAVRGGDGRLSLPLSFEIAGVALLATGRPPGADAGPETAAQGGPPRLELEFYVYALDPAERVVGHRAEAVSIDLDRSGERLVEAGLRFEDGIVLPPGSYELRFLAFAPASRGFALAVREVRLTADRGSPALAAPRFRGACEVWLEARSLAAGSATTGAPAVAARPVLRPGRPAAAAVSLLGVEVLSGWRLASDLRPLGSAATAAWRSAEVTGVRPDGSAGELELELTPPEDLTPGRYELRLSARRAGGEEVLPVTLEIWLVAPDARFSADDCEPSWGEVFRLAVGGAAAPDRPGAAARGRGTAESRLRRRYLGVLSNLSAGRPLAAARVELGEAEQDFLASELDSFARLRELELATAFQVVERDRRCLPILLGLHEEAYEEHFSRRRYGLATHSREIVARLIDDLVRGSDDIDERRLAAAILTSLGDRAERHRVAGAAQGMLERALELDPENLEARFLLATSYERAGRGVAARRHLEELVAASAGHVEARLRLGVLLAREERWEDSERVLRRLLDEGLAGWRRAVAYQTLARALFRRERFAAAAELLTAARAEMPDEQGIALVGAYALERAGRPAEAELWIAELPAADPDGSPRLRYGRPPEARDGVVRSVRERVARNVGVRLPLLAPALAALEGEG